MARRLKFRQRDVVAPQAASEVVRLEKVVSPQPMADLTPLEAQLRQQTTDIQEVRALIATLPEKARSPDNYRFTVHRGADRLIDYVDGIVLDTKQTLLQQHG